MIENENRVDHFDASAMGGDAGESLRASEAYFSQIWEATTDAMALSDPEGIVLDVNPAYLRLYGYSLEQVIGHSFAIIFPKEVREWAVEQYKSVFASDVTPAPFESIVHRADGSERIVESSATFLTIDGKRTAMLSTIRDITARKQAEMAHRTSEARYRAFVHTTTNSLHRLSADGSEFLEVYGGDLLQHRQEAIPTEAWLEEYIHPDDRAATNAAWTTAIATQNPFEMEHRVRQADGSWTWVLSRCVPVHNDAGEVMEWIGSTTNITARKEAEESLRRSQERLRLIMESITEYAIITLDLAGYVTSWNVGAEEMFGYTAAEILGQPGGIIFTPEDRMRGVPTQEMELARRTGRAADERWHLHKDGTRFYVSGMMTPLQDSTIIGYVKVARDLTERKQMEENIRQLNASLEEKVEARTQQVRTLAMQLTMSEQAERRRISQILHDDLQQRLYSLNFYLANLRHALNDENREVVLRILAEINGTLNDAVEATRSLSVDLSPPVLYHEGLVEAIHWLASQMEQQHGLDVTVQAAEGLPLPDEDLRVLLFQIVRELLFNIIKHAGVADARVSLVHENDQICIEVTDAGRGFDVNARDVQSSQGLLRIEQRLQLIGGHFEIEAVLGQGTRVTLCSPLRGGSRGTGEKKDPVVGDTGGQ